MKRGMMEGSNEKLHAQKNIALACKGLRKNMVYRVNGSDYIVEEGALLGSGATANVFRAFTKHEEEEILGSGTLPIEHVALKTFVGETNASNEATILRALQGCSSVVQMLQEGNNFIILELVEGCDLHAKIANDGHLSETNSLGILMQLTSALCEINSRGYAHLDIKLENILVESYDHATTRIKICDFGCAHRLESRLRGIAGTLQYAAPEVHGEKHYHPGPCDIWSLGCVFFTILNGSPPFDKATQSCSYFRLINEQRKRDFYSSHEFHSRVQISSLSRGKLENLLVLNPKKRPSAADFLLHLTTGHLDKIRDEGDAGCHVDARLEQVVCIANP
jgi:serine/threonine protein kinase